jgi:hypothetical protein
MRQATFDGYYEEVRITPGGNRCESGARMSVGPGLAAADFRELREGEVRGDGSSTPAPRSGEPTLGGTIIQPEGIIGALCTHDHHPLSPYVRNPVTLHYRVNRKVFSHACIY